MRHVPRPPEASDPPTREALASFVQAHREQIKASFRARFAAGPVRFYDSSDFFATVSRRADLLTCRLDAVACPDIRRMLRLIMLEALQDVAHAALQERRLKRDLAAGRPRPEPHADDRPGDRDAGLLRRLNLSGDELHIARLRASGFEHATIASTLGISVAAVRMRWHRLLERLRAHGVGDA